MVTNDWSGLNGLYHDITFFLMISYFCDLEFKDKPKNSEACRFFMKIVFFCLVINGQKYFMISLIQKLRQC